MNFTHSNTFELSPNVLYFESDDKVLLTFLSDDEIIFEIDQLAKDAFMLALNHFSFEKILDVSQQIFTGPQDELKKELELLFSNLIDKQILLPKNSE